MAGTLTLADGTIGTGTLAAQGSSARPRRSTAGRHAPDQRRRRPDVHRRLDADDRRLPLVVINKPSGTLTLAGTIRTAANWTYTGGTVDPGTSTVVFAGGTITGTQTLTTVDLRASTSIAAGTTLTVSGSTTLTSGALNGTGTLAAQGDLSETVNSTGGTATLLINGSAGQIFTGTATTAGGDIPLSSSTSHPGP